MGSGAQTFVDTFTKIATIMASVMSRNNYYRAFQIDELYRHNQNLVGTLYATLLLWSTDVKTAKNSKTGVNLVGIDGIHHCH